MLHSPKNFGTSEIGFEVAAERLSSNGVRSRNPLNGQGKMRANYLIYSVSVALLSITIASAAAPPRSIAVEGEPPTTPSLYLVQASTLSASEQSLRRINAKVDREFEIIHAVSAYLTAEQADRLRNTAGVHVFRDRMLSSRSLGSLLGSVVTSVTSTVGAVAAPVVTTATPVVTPVDRKSVV